ncbi:unnamed protein product [Allacma fusca]|uniref:DNA polymerase kappa n=1 Tax=Allacma fusca TaxID=39272 RepID=A0A8J2L3E0_9HEXA|nr:unnamed protein product [Allacma fusca]
MPADSKEVRPLQDQNNVIQLNATKAGMEGLDVASINAIINETSKGSKFYEHKAKQRKEIERKIEEMKKKIGTYPEATVRLSEAEMTKYGEQLEISRNYSRFIVHIDMDAFYASVEMRDDPSLRDKPMAVGSNSMLSTSNYIARRFGVRAAMPGFIARKLCPQLIIVPCNFDKYKAVSRQVQNILKIYDPDFSSISLDEAYLDITNYVETSGKSPEEIVQEMRAKIFEETQLTASAGIASNGFLAKICGDICKPNNQHYLPKTKEDEAKFVKPLPIRKVNGIGGVTEQLLLGLDIHTCEDIWNKRGIINLAFRPITAQWLIRVSKGYQESWYGHDDDSGRKSISCERTLERGTTDVNYMLKIMEKLSEEVASELKSREMRCKSVAIKTKTVDFVLKTRSTSVTNFTSNGSEIFNAAKGLLLGYLQEEKGVSFRLLGVRVSKWDRGDSSTQDHDEPSPKQLKIEDAFAKVLAKSPTFDCPICQDSFASERAVQGHIDSCLGNSAKAGQPINKPTVPRNALEVLKVFTCPICENVIESLIENIELASSDHVNYCISIDAQPTVDLRDKAETWRLRRE